MPPFVNRATIGLNLLLLSCSGALLGKSAIAQVPPQGTLTATQPCPAPRAINGENPGNVELAVGSQYQAFGFNSPRQQYLLVKVPGANPERRWVAATCGEFQASTGEPNPNPNPSPDPQRPNRPLTLLPFFDTETNPVPVENASEPRDISPPPPRLEAFDKKILELCGAEFDAPVDEQKFKRLMSYYPDVVRKLKQVTAGELKPNRRSDAQFIDDLTTIWFAQKGFKHIFCGEKDRNSIGGLHFYGRYLEFQEKGIAGRILRTTRGEDAKEEVVDGAIYTLGVAIAPNGRLIAEHKVKGYAYVNSAQEILINATKAFKLFKPRSVSSQAEACLLTVSDPPAQPFQEVFVKKAGAIRTFYPDATPEDSRTEGPCAN